MASPLVISAQSAALARSNRTTRGVVLAAGFAGVGLALYYAGAAWLAWGFEYALLNVAGALSLTVLLGVVVLKKDYELTEPISLVMLAVGIGVTLKPAYVLFGPREAWPYLLLDRPDPLFLLTPALIVAVAMTMLSLGYLAFSPKSMLGRVTILRPRPWSGRRLAVVSAIAFGLSLIAMALYIQKLGVVNIVENISGKRSFEGEGYETSLGYYRWVASLTQPALLVALAWALHKYKRIPTAIALALAALAFTAVVFPFFNSSRTGIVTILLQAFIVWRCVRGRLPKGVVLAFSLTVLVILLIVTALRPKKTTTADLDISEAVGLDLAIELTVGGRHFLDLTRTSHVIAGVPERLRYQYGQTYFTWVTTPIPRSMWPEKPTLGSGPIIGPRIFGTSGSGVPPGLVGELYLNFGYIGIVFGAFVMGALLRYVHEQFRPYLPTPAGAVLYACIAIPLGWNAVTGDFSRMVVAALTDILPVLLAIAFVSGGALLHRRRRPRRAPVLR